MPGCGERATARGRCNTCYRYWLRTGEDRDLSNEAVNYRRLVRHQERELIRSIYRNAGGL